MKRISCFKFSAFFICIFSCYDFFSRNLLPDSSLYLFQTTFATDGIFLNGTDFIENKILRKSDIITDSDTTDPEFFSKLMNQPLIKFHRNASISAIKPDSIWGFMQNHTLYVNVQGRFFRVPVVGRICYFTAVVDVLQTNTFGGFDPLTGIPVSISTRTKELREFLILFNHHPKPIQFNLKLLEQEFKKNEEIWQAYQKESRKNRRKYITRFIRIYNEKKPL